MVVKKNLKFLIGVFILLGIIIPLISAVNTVTLNLPAQDASISGATYILSASLDTNDFNLTNGTFFYSNGASNVTIGSTANGTATVFNLTWDTTTIVDVDNYVLWVNITNSTYSGDYTGSLDSSTGVDIDNGNPTVTLSSNHFSDLTNVRKSQTFTVAGNADSTIGVSSCVVYFTSTRTSSVHNTTVI